MLAITIDGYSLSALIVVASVFVIVIVVAARLIKRDREVRVAKFGIYVERERFDGSQDFHLWDPFSEDSAGVPAPLPPPTPPPPPPRDEKTQSWPQRDEEA